LPNKKKYLLEGEWDTKSFSGSKMAEDLPGSFGLPTHSGFGTMARDESRRDSSARIYRASLQTRLRGKGSIQTTASLFFRLFYLYLG
jgi:hypothetical protein